MLFQQSDIFYANPHGVVLKTCVLSRDQCFDLIMSNARLNTASNLPPIRSHFPIYKIMQLSHLLRQIEFTSRERTFSHPFDDVCVDEAGVLDIYRVFFFSLPSLTRIAILPWHSLRETIHSTTTLHQKILGT